MSEGGIAPFAIVTNGVDTHILDAVTGELLNDQSIPFLHPHAQRGFVVSGEGLLSRAEATEHLIGLSPANLQAFCNAQVRHAMCALRSEVLDSGMKYIPSLYTPRARESSELEALMGGPTQCILLVGPPQVGKTNFICHTVESLLQAEVPCLFYPAISLDSGVLDAIRNDFGWSFYDSDSALHIARRLARIVQRAGKRLNLFIDGINENLSFVRAFNSELERLQELSVTTVLSLTSYSAAVLLDPYGNLTAGARLAGLKKNDVLTIEMGGTSSPDKISLVRIGPYTSDETEAAYETYADAYHVEVLEDHEKTQDPQILRSAMEVYQNRQLPRRLEAKDILSATIREKLSRLGGLPYHSGQALLDEVARRLSQDAVVGEYELSQLTSDVSVFVNAALLTRRGRGSLDFYITSERSFTIAYRVMGWDETLRRSFDELKCELSSASRCETSKEALRWFFRQPTNWDVLCKIIENFSMFDHSASRVLLVLALCDFVELSKKTESEDDEAEAVTDTLNSFMPATRPGGSPVSDLLLQLVSNPSESLDVRRTSAIGLSSFAPQVCLAGIGKALMMADETVKVLVKAALQPAFNSAIEEILDEFYGRYSMGMCPSYFDSIENDADALRSEYDSLYVSTQAALRFYYELKTAHELLELLILLNPMHKSTSPPDALQINIPFKS